MPQQMQIGQRTIGDGNTYMIAEMSANHNGDLDTAKQIMRAISESGADAVKLQTYTPETMTIDCDQRDFKIGSGTIWEGKKLFDLYGEAYTPWEWHEELFSLANELGMDCFSTPFDNTSVDFLEQFDPPCYKVASFELVDLPLIEYIASKGRPIIMSTGMGSLAEISEAVEVIKRAGVPLALLKCTSAYPSPPESMNLRTIPHLATAFDVPAGLSDHSLEIAVPVAAVTLGATIIEKHFTLSRNDPGPDSAFSLEPQEFKAMVHAIRTAEQAIGKVSYRLTDKEHASKVFRRSLYIVADLKAGDTLTSENVRIIRPGYGLPPKAIHQVLGRTVKANIDRGTALSWDLLQ
ncbi:pseudaminic acid synthase [Novipirellula rosea]|uniref:Pseudaminic acid synthase n=1 Tax=Novipirellula rosea TaxID=1031540 RepID=A0ABP8NP18_9BACT